MRAAAAFLTAAFVLMAVPAKAADPSLVGSWFGEGEPDDPGAVWLAHLSPDGTFKIFFRKCTVQKATVSEMNGRWKVTGTLMEMFVERWNGLGRNYRDGYQILSNNGRTLRYKFTEPGTVPSTAVGHVFMSSRVPATFQIPGCAIVS